VEKVSLTRIKTQQTATCFVPPLAKYEGALRCDLLGNDDAIMVTNRELSADYKSAPAYVTNS